MKKKFSKRWLSSKQTRKQRKYRYNAPLHLRRRMMGSHLSKELREKYNKRSFPVRSGDVVKVTRGQFKGKSGKVVKVILKKYRVYVEGIELTKKDGSKVFYPIHPSNLVITELDLSDPKREVALKRK